MINFYYTIKQRQNATITIKRSKFIGEITPISNEDDVKNFINFIKKEHPGCGHYCHAYKLINGRQRSSDNGEPQGTAGLPILNAIESKNLSNVAIIVSRYFGGILLGKNGLVDAYRSTSMLTIEKTKILKMQLSVLVYIECNYASLGRIEDFISTSKFLIKNIDYLEKVKIKIYIPKEKIDLFKNMFSSTALNDDNFKILEESYQCF